MADDLIERLKAMNADPIGCGLERRWLRNPDGPEAADEIDRLRAALAAAEADANECSLALVERDEKVCALTDALAKAERERDAARAALRGLLDCPCIADRDIDPEWACAETAEAEARARHCLGLIDWPEPAALTPARPEKED